jgi:hypothetical protein
MIRFGPQPENSAPCDIIRWRYPNQLGDFLSSRQNKQGLSFSFLGPVIKITSCICLTGLLLLLRYRKRFSMRFSRLYRSTFLFLLINAWACSTFAVIDEHFNYRVLWLLPFLLLLGIHESTSNFSRKNSAA